MLGEARRDAPLWLAGDVTGRGKVRASGSILREAPEPPLSPGIRRRQGAGSRGKQAGAPRGGNVASLRAGPPHPRRRLVSGKASRGGATLYAKADGNRERKGRNRTGVQTPPPPNLGDADRFIRERSLQPDSRLLVALERRTSKRREVNAVATYSVF